MKENKKVEKTIKSIKEWRDNFKKQRIKLLNKLLNRGKTNREILNAFLYHNMKENQGDFCTLYKENKLCHKTKYLNCYGCDCPFYELTTYKIESNTYIGKCAKQSKKAAYAKYSKEKLLILDCSKCTLPHTSKYSLDFIDKDTAEIERNEQNNL